MACSEICCLPCDEAGDARSLLAREALSARSTALCLPCAERKDLYRPTNTLAPVDMLHLTRAQFRTPRQRLMANEVLARQGLVFRLPVLVNPVVNDDDDDDEHTPRRECRVRGG